MSHPNLRTLFIAASQCKNMSRDIIRQHRNLSSDIAWGLFLVLAFISNPLRGTMSLVLTYNWRLFFVPIEDTVDFSLSPWTTWSQLPCGTSVWWRPEYSEPHSSTVLISPPLWKANFHIVFFFFLLLLHVCLVLSDQNLSFLHPHRDFLCIMCLLTMFTSWHVHLYISIALKIIFYQLE